jgi:hypothetical protein
MARLLKSNVCADSFPEGWEGIPGGRAFLENIGGRASMNCVTRQSLVTREKLYFKVFNINKRAIQVINAVIL